MSKASDVFIVQQSKGDVKLVCKNASAQMGWRIMEETSDKITVKEVASQVTSFTWPAEIEIQLYDNQSQTKIIMNGSIMGLGPIQSNHLKGQMGRFRNLIEIAVTQHKDQSANKNDSNSIGNELEKLADLHSKGILSDEEFKNAKEKLINKM